MLRRCESTHFSKAVNKYRIVMYKQAKFNLSPVTHDNGERPLRVSVSVHGTRLLTTIGQSVRPEFWDNATKTARLPQKSTNAQGLTSNQINALLLRIAAEFEAYEAGLPKTYKPTVEELRDKLAAVTGTKRKTVQSKREKAEAALKAQEEAQIRLEAEKAAKVVNDYFAEFVEEEKDAREWAQGTTVTMLGFGKKLDGFSSLEYLNTEAGIREFISNLKAEDLTNRTIEKKFRLLRWFLTWCERKGYIERVCSYKPVIKLVRRPVIFLKPEELKRLYNYQVPANGTKVVLHTAEGKEYEKRVEDAAALAKTRDLFCFCAYTSLRYSDMAKLRRSDITGEGITVVTKKTHDRVTIELNKYSRAILEKYAGQDFPGGLALPVISNQKMNNYLKDLCELCEINAPVNMDYYKAGRKVAEVVPKFELIGTHAGRRTFVVSALTLGISPEIVMKWTGHSDYQAMRPYIDIVGKAKAEAMEKFNNQ